MIAKKAELIAAHFVELIKKDKYNDQNQMANPASSHWPSHLASRVN
jgi:hypothetical protein